MMDPGRTHDHLRLFWKEAAARLLRERVLEVSLLVVGDVMLDRYVCSDVERISPEAPVPVVRVRHRRSVPGGAGNVALNLAGLGAAVTLVGGVGNDGAGEELRELARREGVRFFGVPDPLLRTVTKTRIVASHQQMLRLDDEARPPLPEESRDRLLTMVRDALSLPFDGVILSDYGKGVCFPELCREVLDAGARAGVPVLVDPKGTDWERYAGATWITPNLRELAAVAAQNLENGDDEGIVRAAREVRRRYGASWLLVTRSEAGMSLVSDHGGVHERAVAREVFDVSGAGDTVVATLGALLAAGLPPEDAMRCANLAAGIVVGKTGTCPVTRDELLQELVEEESPEKEDGSKVVQRGELSDRLAAWRRRGLRVVATNGCFDLLHVGHLSCLERARALGDRLVVAVNSDASVRRLKGAGRPVNSQEARMALLAGLSCVDLVTMFDEDTPGELYRSLRPDVLVKGGDYTPSEVVGREYAGETVIFPLVAGYSTTALLRRGSVEGEP